MFAQLFVIPLLFLTAFAQTPSSTLPPDEKPPELKVYIELQYRSPEEEFVTITASAYKPFECDINEKKIPINGTVSFCGDRLIATALEDGNIRFEVNKAKFPELAKIAPMTARGGPKECTVDDFKNLIKNYQEFRDWLTRAELNYGSTQLENSQLKDIFNKARKNMIRIRPATACYRISARILGTIKDLIDEPDLVPLVEGSRFALRTSDVKIREFLDKSVLIAGNASEKAFEFDYVLEDYEGTIGGHTFLYAYAVDEYGNMFPFEKGFPINTSDTYQSLTKFYELYLGVMKDMRYGTASVYGTVDLQGSQVDVSFRISPMPSLAVGLNPQTKSQIGQESSDPIYEDAAYPRVRVFQPIITRTFTVERTTSRETEATDE
jgi:hypothetical protein